MTAVTHVTANGNNVLSIAKYHVVDSINSSLYDEIFKIIIYKLDYPSNVD